MSDSTSSGGGAAPFLAFLVGALIVVVAVIGYFLYAGGLSAPKTTEINVHPPAAGVPAAPAPAGSNGG